jgi:predicted site-specific integrase-resolvase
MKTKERTIEDLVSGPRIARSLDVDPATIRRWAREGMPAHVIGEGFVRYRMAEVLAWRATRKSKSRKEAYA